MEKTLPVLIETDKEGYSFGHTTNYLEVKIKGNLKQSIIYNVKIIEIDYPYCIGQIC